MNEAFIQVGKMMALFGEIENLYNNVIAKYYVVNQSRRDEFFLDVMRAKHMNIELKRSLSLEIIKRQDPATYGLINKVHTENLISLRNIVAHSSIIAHDDSSATFATYEEKVLDTHQIMFMGAGGRKKLVSDVYEDVFKIGIPIKDHLIDFLSSAQIAQLSQKK